MKYLLTLLLLFGTVVGRARTADVPPPAADGAGKTLEELSAEIEALKEKSSGWEKLLARMPKVSGYLSLGYEWSDDGTSSFYVKRVRMSLSGELVPKLDYRFQIEFAAPKVLDVYLRYRPFTQLNVKLGQYKIPFSIENTEYAPLKFEFIEYPLALTRMMGFSETVGDKSLRASGRELGATLYGGFFERDGYCILNYDLSLFNGAGLNTKDDNKSKDVAARLIVRPLPGLQIAGSFYRGEAGTEYLKRLRYGAGACYDEGPVVVRGEWIGGETGIQGSKSTFRSSGWYAMGGWRVLPSLMPVARYDTLLANTDQASSRQTNYTLGMVWQPRKFLRFHLCYTYEDYKISATNNRNVVQTMIYAAF